MFDCFKEIAFPDTLEYRSDNEHVPVEFYVSVIPISHSIDMHLGFFSSNAIEVLNTVFAQFIYNGGRLRLIVNNILSPEDKEHLIINKKISNELRIKKIFENLDSLRNELNGGQHFFDCLKYLIMEDRFSITPVVTVKDSLSHYKNMIYYDKYGNSIYTEGSANFTAKGILTNGESFNVSRSWGNEPEIKRLQKAKNRIEEIISKKHKEYKYLNPEEIKCTIVEIGNDKTKEELVVDSSKLYESVNSSKIREILKTAEVNFNNLIRKLREEPRFPYDKPREYQVKAYHNWCENNYQGIFAMATGTGKTITSLNCVLEVYKDINFYNVLILVPTRALVTQWVEEVKKFNFQNIHTTQSKSWESELSNYLLYNSTGKTNNFIIISTYQSFQGDKFKRLMRYPGWKDFILIADEAHNMGSSKLINYLPTNIHKRIGLSATPERVYDDQGSQIIYKYFGSNPPCYTYSYSMYRAIYEEPSSLVNYFYYPYFTYLTESELIEYRRISEKLIMHYDAKTDDFDEEGKKYLIKRKRIINKAENKIHIVKEIISKVHAIESDLKYTFVYVPEGVEVDYSDTDTYQLDKEDVRLIDKYSKEIRSTGYSVHKLLADTKEREKVFRQFSEGKIDILLSMKILDEGVDIPRTKNAIFCASTGNPRQYIQRRGRVLRKYEGKTYANIFDIIVAPQEMYINSLPENLRDMEIRIFRNELRRVANFLYAAENRHQVLNDKLGNLATKYGIDLVLLMKDNLDIDKNCN